MDTPIWFLMVLFLTEIFYDLIMKMKNHFAVSLAAVSASFVLWFFFGRVKLPLFMNLLPMGIAFYGTGDLLKRFFRAVPKASELKKIIFLLIPLGAFSFLLAYYNVRVVYTKAVFGNIFFCMGAALSGVMFYILLFFVWNPSGKGLSKVLCYIGENSLILLVTQFLVFYGYKIVSEKIWREDIVEKTGTVKALVLSAVTVVIILSLTQLYKKIFRNSKLMRRLGAIAGIK